MKNKIIPIKQKYSSLDAKEWDLVSVDFYPFKHQEDFAEEINNICQEVQKDEDFLATLEKAKLFACSTLVPNGNGEFYRAFFETPQALQKFILNYKKQEGK